MYHINSNKFDFLISESRNERKREWFFSRIQLEKIDPFYFADYRKLCYTGSVLETDRRNI